MVMFKEIVAVVVLTVDRRLWLDVTTDLMRRSCPSVNPYQRIISFSKDKTEGFLVKRSAAVDPCDSVSAYRCVSIRRSTGEDMSMQDTSRLPFQRRRDCRGFCRDDAGEPAEKKVKLFSTNKY